jgi:hypothetical protein
MVTEMVKGFHAFVDSKVFYLRCHSPLFVFVMNWLSHVAEIKEAIQV